MIFPVLFLLFLGVNSVSNKVFAQSENITSGAHLITIYDRGEQQVEVTDAPTIAEALKDAGIEIDKSDRVEPAMSEKLVAKEYSINIYRARPVLVVDGNTKQKVITAYQTALQIAKDADIKLYNEDIATLTRTNDIISDGAGLKLEIKRATDVNFNLYGKFSDVKTQAKTIADFLKEKNITLSSDDKVLPVESTKILPGMQIRLWREGIQTVNLEEPVNFDVREIQDGDREIGYREVRTSGVVGSKTVTYEVLIQNGKEVSRKEIANIVTKQPTEQVELVGVKPKWLPYTGGGVKTDWLRSSGIAESDWGYVDYIITKESGWNPNALNSSSGACGLAQALPCSKVPGNPLNPIDNLRWANAYANTCVSYRMYCGWQGAYNYWTENNWW